MISPAASLSRVSRCLIRLVPSVVPVCSLASSALARSFSTAAATPASSTPSSTSSPSSAAKPPSGPDARRPPPSKLDRLKLVRLYTLRTPLSHTDQDVRKYYNIPREMLNSLPESLNREITPELSFGGDYMMVRPNALALTKQLASIQAKTHLNSRVIGIRGEKGMGKSHLVHYLAQWARESNWFLLYFNVRDFFTDTRSMIRLKSKEPNHIPKDVPVSPVFETVNFNQSYFSNLMKMDGETLKKIAIKGQETLKLSGLKEGATLYDLAEAITKDAENCSDLTNHFVTEVQQITEMPTLVLIDNANSVMNLTEYLNPWDNYSRVPARQISFIRAFERFCHKPIAYGASVFAFGPHASPKAESSRWWDKRKVHAVTMDVYDDTELMHSIVHYHISGSILREPEPKLVQKTKGVTGGIPAQVLKYAGLL